MLQHSLTAVLLAACIASLYTAAQVARLARPPTAQEQGMHPDDLVATWKSGQIQIVVTVRWQDGDTEEGFRKRFRDRVAAETEDFPPNE